jgi:hypothetical protein
MTILETLVCLFVVVYLVLRFILALEEHRCQKKWFATKVNRIKIDPNVTRAELCELYVDFCRKNNCKVDF